jgi:hypothetical protein
MFESNKGTWQKTYLLKNTLICKLSWMHIFQPIVLVKIKVIVGYVAFFSCNLRTETCNAVELRNKILWVKKNKEPEVAKKSEVEEDVEN